MTGIIVMQTFQVTSDTAPPLELHSGKMWISPFFHREVPLFNQPVHCLNTCFLKESSTKVKEQRATTTKSFHRRERRERRGSDFKRLKAVSRETKGVRLSLLALLGNLGETPSKRSRFDGTKSGHVPEVQFTVHC